jgi:hypothetical protein
VEDADEAQPGDGEPESLPEWRVNVDHQPVAFGSGQYEVRIDNESGKVNVNTATGPRLRMLLEGIELDERLRQRIRATIRENTTPRHVPAKIVAVPEIPRTKSGKIVELAVRAVVHGEAVKNTDALANPEALAHFKDLAELAC